MFLPNPGVLAAGVGGRRTYDDWLAHESATEHVVRDWLITAVIAIDNVYRTTCGNPAGGVMIGSPWLSQFRGGTGNTSAARVVQHALPSLPAFNQQVTDGRDIFFKVVGGVNSTYDALNRNGFESSSSASTGAPRRVSWLRYFDPILGPVEMQPFLGLGPEPYDW